MTRQSVLPRKLFVERRGCPIEAQIGWLVFTTETLEAVAHALVEVLGHDISDSDLRRIVDVALAGLS